MALKPHYIGKVEGKKFFDAVSSFDETSEALINPKTGLRLATVYDIVKARLVKGKSGKYTKAVEYLRNNGGYTSHAVIDANGAYPLVARISPFLNNRELLRKGIEANRANKYFSTEDNRLYSEFLKQAEEDASKPPFERRVLIFPAGDKVSLSQTSNPENFEGIFGDIGTAYLQDIAQDSVDFFPISRKTIKDYNGTAVTEMWFRNVGDRSELDGYGGLLGYDWAFGVLESAEGTSQKILESKIETKVKPAYTPKQIVKNLGIIQGVREGRLPNSRLEQVVKFLEGLKQ